MTLERLLQIKQGLEKEANWLDSIALQIQNLMEEQGYSLCSSQLTITYPLPKRRKFGEVWEQPYRIIKDYFFKTTWTRNGEDITYACSTDSGLDGVYLSLLNTIQNDFKAKKDL